MSGYSAKEKLTSTERLSGYCVWECKTKRVTRRERVLWDQLNGIDGRLNEADSMAFHGLR
jgi:hypothetical protein